MQLKKFTLRQLKNRKTVEVQEVVDISTGSGGGEDVSTGSGASKRR